MRLSLTWQLPTWAESASASIATGKAITLDSLRWLSPVAILVIALLLLWCVLQWINSYLRPEQSDRTFGSDESVGQTETEYGRIYLAEPDRVDNLDLYGIDSEKQKRLHALGIYQVEQFQCMTPGQLAVLRRKVGLPNIDWNSVSRAGHESNVEIGSVADRHDAAADSAASGAVAVASVASVATAALVANGNETSSAVPEPHFNKKSNVASVSALKDSGQGSAASGVETPASSSPGAAAGLNGASASSSAIAETSPQSVASSRTKSTEIPTQQRARTEHSAASSAPSNTTASNVAASSVLTPSNVSQDERRSFKDCFGTVYSSATSRC